MNIAYSHDIEENARIIRESLSRRERHKEPVIHEYLRNEYHQTLAKFKESGIIDAHKLRILRFFVRQQKLQYNQFKRIVFTHQRERDQQYQDLQ